jgi:hypothetical protein
MIISKKNIVCLFTILILYWLHFQIIEEAKVLSNLKPPLRGVIFLLLLPLVGIIGFLSLKGKLKSVTRSWVLIYVVISFLSFVTAIALKLFKYENHSWMELIDDLRGFFTSPLPLAIFLYFSRVIEQKAGA